MFWKGVLGYLPVNLVQGVVGMLGIVVFTRVLRPQDYGVYALAFSVMSLVHTAVFLWLEAAMARFYAPEAEAGRLPGHFRTLYGAFALLAAGFPLLAGTVLWVWPAPTPLKIAIGAGLATILFRSLAKLVQERRRAAGDVRAAALLDVTMTAGGFAAGAGLALAGFGGASPLVGMGAAAAVCLVFALPTELKQVRGGPFEPARARMYAAYGVPVSLSLILSLALATTDRFLLAAYLNETSVGVYHAGYSLANRTLDVMFIWLGMAGGPAAIAALERGGKAALHETAREQARLMIALALPAAVGLALVARPLADVMIGERLRAGAAEVTPWIAASAFLAGITTYYFHTAFTLARRTGLLLAAMAIPAASNVVLCLVLIPRFGLQGALWATLASYGLGAAASFGLGRRALALPVPWDTAARAAAASAAMALAVRLVPAGGGALELFAKAGVGVAVYGALAWLLDICGARTHSGRLVRALQARIA
ncbi:MAG: lipopolysaccharide biosynthesis protein [Caulobacteraceae bacterium]|nr:lipopolysaccharide biosynthesis protein [Caulobacteraceae bacterium]